MDAFSVPRNMAKRFCFDGGILPYYRHDSAIIKRLNNNGITADGKRWLFSDGIRFDNSLVTIVNVPIVIAQYNVQQQLY